MCNFTSFRELLLSHNHLRVLPYELGKLFQLHVLGLQGNPLSKEILSLYGESNGTHKLLTYMLDSLQGRAFLICISLELLCQSFTPSMKVRPDHFPLIEFYCNALLFILRS